MGQKITSQNVDAQVNLFNVHVAEILNVSSVSTCLNPQTLTCPLKHAFQLGSEIATDFHLHSRDHLFLNIRTL